MADETSETDYKYEVLSADELREQREDIAKQVSDILKVPSNITTLLLINFNWDRDKLIETFFKCDTKELLKKANINLTNDTCRPDGHNLQAKTCEICLSSFPSSEMIYLNLSQSLCLTCWSISGADLDCNTTANAILTSVIKKPPQLRYDQLVTNSYVACNKLLRRCPAADCTYAVKVQYIAKRPVVCKCGIVFCVACGEKWHVPVKCEWFDQWVKAGKQVCFVVDQKRCPKCNEVVKRNNSLHACQVVCENCKYNFCFLCRAATRLHALPWFSCSYFRDLAEESSHIQPRSEYHFYRGYMKHEQSLEQEEQLQQHAKSLMAEMEKNGIPFYDVQFVKEAVDVLCRSRRTLMFTYVLTFYVTQSNQLWHFEQQQEALEKEAEELAKFVEEDLTWKQLAAKKDELVYKCACCDERHKLLLKLANDGYKEGIWKCRFSKEELETDLRLVF